MSIIDKLGITPGKWKAKIPPFNGGAKVYQEGSGRTLCRDYDESLREKVRIRMSIPDALLIATAPEMLEDLIDTMIDIERFYFKCYNDDIMLSEKWSKKIKTIEKATGKSWSEIKELRGE